MLDGKEDFVLLDVRQEIDKKFFIRDPRLLEIGLDVLNGHWQKVPAGKKIVIFDLLGKQTPIAARYLHGKGRQNILRVSGGITQYIKDGYPVEVR